MGILRAAIAASLMAVLVASGGCSVIYPMDDQADRWQVLGDIKAQLRMAYREEGAGPPVLLIHGLGRQQL